MKLFLPAGGWCCHVWSETIHELNAKTAKTLP